MDKDGRILETEYCKSGCDVSFFPSGDAAAPSVCLVSLTGELPAGAASAGSCAALGWAMVAASGLFIGYALATGTAVALGAEPVALKLAWDTGKSFLGALVAGGAYWTCKKLEKEDCGRGKGDPCDNSVGFPRSVRSI